MLVLHAECYNSVFVYMYVCCTAALKIFVMSRNSLWNATVINCCLGFYATQKENNNNLLNG